MGPVYISVSGTLVVGPRKTGFSTPAVQYSRGLNDSCRRKAACGRRTTRPGRSLQTGLRAAPAGGCGVRPAGGVPAPPPRRRVLPPRGGPPWHRRDPLRRPGGWQRLSLGRSLANTAPASAPPPPPPAAGPGRAPGAWGSPVPPRVTEPQTESDCGATHRIKSASVCLEVGGLQMPGASARSSSVA